MQPRNITVVGAGYVGLSLAVLLAPRHRVQLLDIDAAKVDLICQGISPLADAEIQQRLPESPVHATTDAAHAYTDADTVIIATPTNYDSDNGYFDTSSVEACVAEAARRCPQALVIIKSTVPVGFTTALQQRFADMEILFSPEFLREGRALHDNLYPSRIVVGGNSPRAQAFGQMLADCAKATDIAQYYCGSTEAEAIKLFANTYLAMRVAFFNELDSFAEIHHLNTRHIIDGVCADSRIGHYYNNPSFGYGGYCLPTDTEQLRANYFNVPNQLIGAIVEANRTRKDFIAHQILKRQPHTVGIYRLAMKNGADNFRVSAIQSVMKRLQGRGVHVVVYEPALAQSHFLNAPVITDLAEFIRLADVIVANRQHPDLAAVADKVYSRDLFGSDQ